MGQLSKLIAAVGALSCYRTCKEKKCELRTKSSTMMSVTGNLKSDSYVESTSLTLDEKNKMGAVNVGRYVTPSGSITEM